MKKVKPCPFCGKEIEIKPICLRQDQYIVGIYHPCLDSDFGDMDIELSSKVYTQCEHTKDLEKKYIQEMIKIWNRRFNYA